MLDSLPWHSVGVVAPPVEVSDGDMERGVLEVMAAQYALRVDTFST